MTTLKIDLDGKVTPCRWVKWCRKAVQRLDLMGIDPARIHIDVRRSPSGGVHVRLQLWETDLNDVEVIAAQAILGSDGKREALNLARAMRGEPANVLHTHRDGQPWGEPWPAALVTWMHTLPRR